MPTNKLTNRTPAPIVKDERPPVAFDLYDASGNVVRKFPHCTGRSNLRILRFVAPNHANPNGMVVAAGYPPFDPAKVGYVITTRQPARVEESDADYFTRILSYLPDNDPARPYFEAQLSSAVA